MPGDSFTDAALILVGHGSTKNTASSAPVCQHAAELRRRGIFAEVRECFWKVEPRVQGALAWVAARRVFVVPLFMGEGFFTGEAIPQALGLRVDAPADAARRQVFNGQLVHYCQPVGTHPAMTGVVLARARGVVEQFPFPRAPRPEETTLFLAAHGTTRNENSRKTAERQAGILRERDLYADVHAVFLLEKPAVAECYTLAGTRNLVVVPFFISDGLHASEDLPVLLGAPERVVRERLARGQPAWRNPTERRGKLVWYTGSVGTEPALAEVILERVREANDGEAAAR